MQGVPIEFEVFRSVPEHVAAILPAEQVFSLLRRSFDVPVGWVALASHVDGVRTLVRAGESVEAAGITDLLLVRSAPVPIELHEMHIPSADGYQCHAQVRLSVGIACEPADLESFRQAVLSSADRATADTLRTLVQWQCRRALVQFAEKRPAADLVDGKDREAASALMAERLHAVLFPAGLISHQAPLTQFECSAFAEVRRERAEVARLRDKQAAHLQLQNAVAEARRQHLSHLEALLAQLQTLSDKTPTVGVADLIRTFAEPQRGQLYAALWNLLPGEEKTQWIVTVAGMELLCFDPTLPDAPARRVRIDGAAGALRSVRVHRQPDDGKVILLVGAARGVYEVDVDDLRVGREHVFAPSGGRELHGGVNAAATTGHHCFGTHSEAGLIRWVSLGVEGEVPWADFPLAELTAGAKAVRGAQVLRGQLVLSVDKHVLACPADAVTPANTQRFEGGIARITAVHAIGDDLFAADEVGDLWQWALASPGKGQCLRRGEGSPVESLQRIIAGGLPHLVFAERRATALQLIPLGDTFVCRYETGDDTVRRAAVSEDLLVAMNEARDRLLCWRPGEPREPFTTINVAAQCSHSIQDLCLVTETTS